MKMKKTLAFLLAATFSLGNIGFVATAENETEYFSFFDDFSEYNNTNSITVLDSGTTDEGIEAVWTGLTPTSEVTTIATHSSGAKWLSPANSKWFCSYNGNTYARMGISDSKDALVMKGWGNGWTTTAKLDVGEDLNLGNVQKISFKMLNTARESGMTMFINENEDSFFLFGMRRNVQWDGVFTGNLNTATQYSPFVAQYNGTGYSIIDYDTTASGWNSTDNQIEWEVISENGKILWNVKDNGGHSWSGACDDEGLPKKSRYLCGAFAIGDERSCINSIDIKCGDYYNGGLGEPKEVIYRNIASTITPTEDGVFAQSGTASPIRRVTAIVPKTVTEGTIELSNDGVNFESFDMNITSGRKLNTLTWFNDKNDGKYKYIKLPTESCADGYLEVMLILTDTDENTTIEVSQYGTDKLYLYKDGNAVTSGSWKSSNDDYVTIASDGTITGIKDSLIVDEIPTVSIDGTYEKLLTNISVAGDYTNAVNNGTEAMNTYITAQQTIIDYLNNALVAGDKTAVSKFFTSDWTEPNSLARIDVVTTNDIKNLSEIKLTAFIDRLLTLDGHFTVASIEDIQNFEKKLLREVYTEELCNVSSADTMKSLLNTYGNIIGIDTSLNYYKNVEEAASQTLLSKSFANADCLVKAYEDAIVLQNIHNSINTVYIQNLIENYKNNIGYDADRYAVQDKSGLMQSIIDNNQNITTTEMLKNYIDTYVYVPKQSTTSTGSSGGGGGGIGVITPVKTDKEETTVAEKTKIFSDVETDFWGYEAIRYLLAKKAISGYEDNAFRPNNSITRAEFLTITLSLFGLNGEIAEETVNPFEDLKDTDWYYKTMMRAYEMGIVVGDGTHCYPDSQITRQEIAVIIMRILNSTEKSISSNTEIMRFSDDDTINDWASGAVYQLRAAGVISGNNNMFLPMQNATRAEAAAMAYRAINSIVDQTIEEASVNE